MWGGNGEGRKFHLVSRNKVCSPVFCTGLGVQNLMLFNKDLLGKWLWQYHLERGALWRNIIDVQLEDVGELVFS